MYKKVYNVLPVPVPIMYYLMYFYAYPDEIMISLVHTQVQNY